MAIPAGRNFASCYMELCKQQRLRPLPVICVTLPHNLDFTTDRIKMDDWRPILNSLSLDRSLKSISVHSRYQCRKPLEEINSEDKARAMGKAPVVLTRYLLEWLSQSIGQCVRNSPNLTHLELEGIPFPPDCIAVLCVGLSGTQTLHHLSLRRCYIGDNGCELICRTIADIRSVKSLNLSYCDLTPSSGSALASALSRQKLALYHDTWKQSLRYREPNFETMPGLRRLTLNDNPHLGNCAVMEMIEAIRDSLWMKALDLQHCGLTDQIGADLMNLLDQNNTLTVLDVRKNVNLNDELATEVMRRLVKNDVEGKSEYKWMGLTPKDKKIASTDTRRGRENEDTAKLLRARSVFTKYTKRPCQIIPPRRTVPISLLSTKMKIRPLQPDYRNITQQRDSIHSQMINNVQTMPKVSLHLDLQSRIQPVVNHVDCDVEKQSKHKDTVQCIDETSLKSFDSTKIDVGMQSVDQQSDSEEIQCILRQLAEAQAEHDRLLKETKQTDLLLAEERARREAAEMNLQSAQDNLVKLECALQKKENETRGYLLVSEQSLNEICLSFDRLLEILENVTDKYPYDGTLESQQIVSADIKRCITSVIRQTKSENLKRGYKVGIELPQYIVDGAQKFVKSESDVRSMMPIPATYLEKKIGECLENNELHHRYRDVNKPMSSVDRARVIFASIISGEAIDLC
ncbi:Centrosomal protein of 78 kDa [Trachymyrmex septentrionalis]|uniref:Centrosomal protein of 78 kDa n=1 Tax=Trachymyrmex septentrionalis TaxID=34720 RepID=A0A195EU54_9HYME|nr:PREDICTED: protein Cep78 homolog [Trachymyrmex septentrionalis]KYN31686.1 Centrosomal protein of 78 kDa [Trachymyrmex septentrionalis]